MTGAPAAGTLAGVSAGLVEVMVTGTPADARVMDELAGNLGRFDLRAFPNPVEPERPMEYEAAASVPAVVVLWTRSAAASEWLTESVDVARKATRVVVAICDDVELPSWMTGVPAVDITRWLADGDVRSLEHLATVLHDPASDPSLVALDPSAVKTADGEPLAVPATTTPGDQVVDLAGFLPEVRGLLVMADGLAGRRGAPATGLDVVLAALVLPLTSGDDPAMWSDAAEASVHAAVPEPRSDRIDAALAAAHAGSLDDVATPDPAAPAVNGSPGLASLLDQAHRLAVEVAPPAVTKEPPPPPEAHSRHLLGVALAGTTLPPAVASALGAGDDDLRAALLERVRQQWPEEDATRWATLLAGPPGEAVATFHHDDTRRRDLLDEDSLDIAPHVRALALLVGSKVLKPPLAVGLFGDWGSGKTYFMRALRQEVDRLTRQARDSGLPQRELPVYRNVAQIEFNAWHFVDTDLWATLADYIFANLRITETEDADEVSRRRELYVAKLSEQGAAIRQVESKRQHLEERIALSETELEQVRSQKRRELGIEQQARAALKVSDDLKGDVDDLAARLGLPAVGTSVADLESALVQARDVTTGARSTLGVLSGRFGRGWSLLAFAALLLGPLVLWLTSYVDVDGVQRAAATVAGVIASAAAWVRTATSAAGRTLTTINELGAALDEEVTKDPELVERKKALDELRAEEERLAAEEAGLREELAEVQQALRELDPAKVLADFILSRNDSDDYRKHLGLASLIRRDFETLAEHIDGFNTSLEREEVPEDGGEQSAAAEGGDGEGADRASPSEVDYHVNRIVLYIDDLDRCPPETVAKVLQAVHLLLAFPLFVVVVGVDARWLSRSLTKHYEGLLDSADRDDDDGSASPQDYLEKIFQIPFWLRPMPLDATGRLLDALTETRASSSNGDTGATRSGESAGAQPDRVAGAGGLTAPQGAGASDGGADASATPGEGATAEASEADEGAPPEPPAYDLRLASTDISQAERDFMQELRPMLGRSPRSLTRYVNIVRLLKAVDRHDKSLAEAATQDDPDHVTMFLLAVLTGCPDVAQALLTEIARPRGQDEGDGLAAAVRRAREASGAATAGPHPGAACPADRQWEELEQWLAEHEEWVAEQHVGTWPRRAQRVARYSYRFDAMAPDAAR